jgi:GT2 family glycosyltransferase
LKNNIKIGLVVVLYKKKISKAETIRSLKKIRLLDKFFKVILIDNYNSEQPKLDIESIKEFKFKYFNHSKKNHLGYSYKYSINYLYHRGCEWSLLLDHDSKISLHFIDTLINIVYSNIHTGCSIICPNVIDHNKIISPAKEYPGGILKPIKSYYKYKIYEKLFCIGSGMTVNNKIYLDLINDFEDFQLDFLDRYICNTMSINKFNFLHIDSHLNHSLSINNFDKLVTADRYSSIIRSENIFMSKFRGSFTNIFIYKLRLLYRVLLFVFRKRNNKFILILIRSFLSKKL